MIDVLVKVRAARLSGQRQCYGLTVKSDEKQEENGK